LALTNLSSAPAESDADGYLLFRRACTHYESLNVSPELLEEISALTSEGGKVSADLALLLRETKVAYRLMTSASVAEVWNAPDRRQFDASTALGYYPAWRGINRLAPVSASLSLKEDNAWETFQFLAGLNDVGMRIVRTGLPLDFLTHAFNRSAHYPIITSVIAELSED